MAFHRFCRAMLRGEPIAVYGDGRQSRDFTFIADAIEANVRAWRRAAPQGVYNIGGGSQVEVLEAIQLLEERLGVKAQLRFEERPPGDPMRTRADASRLAADLDYATTVSIGDGLAAEAEWARTLYGGAR
jgi:UDP-glucose 4-epimerase